MPGESPPGLCVLPGNNSWRYYGYVPPTMIKNPNLYRGLAVSTDFPTLLSDEEFEAARTRQTTQESSEYKDRKAVLENAAPSDGKPECTIEQRFPHVARQLVAMWRSEACS